MTKADEQVTKLLNILQTVAQMRKTQKLYFKQPDKNIRQGLLMEAKQLEASVDMRLEEIGVRAL